MLKKMVVLLVLLVLLLPALPAWGQSETWYYGWDNDSGTVQGFNLNGGITPPLLSLDPDIPPLGWRLDAARVLVRLSTQGIDTLYVLAPERAQQILPLAGAENLLPLVAERAVQSGDYVILEAQEGAFAAGLVVNLRENTVEPLTGETFAPIDNWRISADGSTLRYLSRDARDSTTWSLWGRDLPSGDELNLLSFESPFPNIQASPGGDFWLERSLVPPLLTHTLLRGDGTSETLASETVPEQVQTFTSYQLLGEQLLIYTAPCEPCVLERRSLLGAGSLTYRVARMPSAQLNALAGVGGDRLLVLIEDTYWLLNPNADAMPLGKYASTLFSSAAPQELLSPSGEWLITAEETGAFKLWNVAGAVVALDGSVGGGALVDYTARGVIITQFDPPQTTIYRFADGQTLSLGESGFFYEILADGSLLYAQAEEAGGRPSGVYRYNPVDGAYILIMQNLFPLQVD